MFLKLCLLHSVSLTDAFTIAPLSTTTTRSTAHPLVTGYHNVKINGHSIVKRHPAQRSFFPAATCIDTDTATATATATGTATATALHMVSTKSGGRAIISELQFQIEVLHQFETDNDDSDSISDSISDSDSYVDDSDGNDNNKQQSKPSSSPTTTTTTTKTTTDFHPCKTPTLVFFSAPWCGPCRLSNPVVKDIIKLFVPKIDVVEVCTDDLPDIAEQAGVTSIPTIQIYHQGELLDTIVGCVAKNVLGNAVNKVLEDLGLDDDDGGGGSEGEGGGDSDGECEGEDGDTEDE